MPPDPVADYPQTADSIRRALEFSNAERRRISELTGRVIPLHPVPGSPQSRLDDFRLDERCAVDGIADAISFYLYGKAYDRLPVSVRTRVEGAALRAVRAPQAAWTSAAWMRAHKALDHAMTEAMGPVFAMQAPAARQALARIGVASVLSALTGVFEVAEPFEIGDALQIYDAATAAQREVR